MRSRRSPGRVGRWVDAGRPGCPGRHRGRGRATAIPPDYDPMIAKVMAVGRDRASAIDRLRRALDEVEVTGIQTTLPFHRVARPRPGVRRRPTSRPTGSPTHWDGAADRAQAAEVAVVRGRICGTPPASPRSASRGTSVRKDTPAAGPWRDAGRRTAIGPVAAMTTPRHAGDQSGSTGRRPVDHRRRRPRPPPRPRDPRPASRVPPTPRPPTGRGRRRRLALRARRRGCGARGPPRAGYRATADRRGGLVARSRSVPSSRAGSRRSPWPWATRSRPVRPLLVVEAMKMQNELRAPRAGTVQRVAVGAGATVEVGDVLVVLG